MSCDFCQEFVGTPNNSSFARIYEGRPESRLLFRSETIVAIPSLGQLVEGYLLVLPTEHFKAVGDLPSGLLQEFAAICGRVGKTLKDKYGPYILFEHGVRSEGVGGCGVYHAHLHAVPLPEALDPVGTLKLKFPYAELKDLNEISKRSAGLSSYLFYQDLHAGLYLFDTGPLPSQYMRKLLADSLGIQDWDWRKAGREERLLTTMRRLSEPLNGRKEIVRTPSL